MPRASHARYEPSADRPDPVSILEKQNEGRVPKLVPVRYAFLDPKPLPCSGELRTFGALSACLPPAQH